MESIVGFCILLIVGQEFKSANSYAIENLEESRDNPLDDLLGDSQTQQQVQNSGNLAENSGQMIDNMGGNNLNIPIQIGGG